MPPEGFDLAARLHWSVAWLLLPATAAVAITGAARTDLTRAWRRVLGVAAAATLAALAMRAARHGLQHWHIPTFVWLAAPAVLVLLAVSARDSWPLAVLFVAGLFVGVMGWVALALRALGGPIAMSVGNDALLAVAAPLLVAGCWKHLRTPVPTAPEPPAPCAPDPAREAAVAERLASDEAQESADKYTRE